MQHSTPSPNPYPSSQPLIITGMHRSGTSLTTSMLQAAGLDVGDQLLPAGPANRQGYFEDIEFVRLHQEILKSQGISTEGWVLHNVDVPQQFLSQVHELCDRRSRHNALWGWKDPRTTLFLDFWQEQLPNAKFVFPYRAPWEVIDSLFTRGDEAFTHHPKFAVEVWMAYNQLVLAFCQMHPEKTFLVSCEVLKERHQDFIDKVAHKLSIELFELKQSPFKADEMHSQVSQTYRPALLAEFFPDAIAVYQALENAADLPASFSTNFSGILGTQFSCQDWILQDWLTTKQTHSKLTAQIQMMQAEAAHFQQQSRQQLEALNQQLAAAQAVNEHWQRTVEAMQASRFWKLRDAWLIIKDILHIG